MSDSYIRNLDANALRERKNNMDHPEGDTTKNEKAIAQEIFDNFDMIVTSTKVHLINGEALSHQAIKNYLHDLLS